MYKYSKFANHRLIEFVYFMSKIKYRLRTIRIHTRNVYIRYLYPHKSITFSYVSFIFQ